MTKTYNINGKEVKIDEASPRDTLISLLEALSDKEKDKFSPTEELLKMCNKGYIGGELEHEIYKPGEPLLKPKKEDCGACDYEEKHNRKITLGRHTCTKQKVCEGDCYFCNPLGWADRNPASTVTTESSEKMRLEHMKNREPKQSTSLKEEIAKLMIKENEIGRSITVNWFNFTAEKITKLIQSYLVKEIESCFRSMSSNSQYDCGFSDAKQDIIRIINNT